MVGTFLLPSFYKCYGTGWLEKKRTCSSGVQRYFDITPKSLSSYKNSLVGEALMVKERSGVLFAPLKQLDDLLMASPTFGLVLASADAPTIHSPLLQSRKEKWSSSAGFCFGFLLLQ